MTKLRRIERSVRVAAPVEVVFAAITDWEAQGRWMLGTRVEADGTAASVGGRLRAFTGVGRLGFVDTMEITVWEPPRCVEVRHTGRVVRGTGLLVVRPLADGSSRLLWGEELHLPLGMVGQFGFTVARPLFAAGVARSLERFAALVQSGQIGSNR